MLRGHAGTIESYDPSNVKEPKAFDAKGRAVAMEIVKREGNSSLSPKRNPTIIAMLVSAFGL